MNEKCGSWNLRLFFHLTGTVYQNKEIRTHAFCENFQNFNSSTRCKSWSLILRIRKYHNNQHQSERLTVHLKIRLNHFFCLICFNINIKKVVCVFIKLYQFHLSLAVSPTLMFDFGFLIVCFVCQLIWDYHFGIPNKVFVCYDNFVCG